jgi:5-(carboxyamino)imidazole ribonucleotide mutase
MANAQVAIIMGSNSDWPIMKQAAEVLDSLGISYLTDIVSAHRTPQKMSDFAASARDKGFSVIIAGAGGAAHLPGMVASMTTLPVVGVPVPLAHMDGLDSLLSIVQMPTGVPVATVAIGGAKNAGYLAARIIGATDSSVQKRLEEFHAQQTQKVLDTTLD